MFSLTSLAREAAVRTRLNVVSLFCQGMNFLHHRQVIHRDLKSLNLLLAAPVGSATVPSVKISDFGLSRGTARAQEPGVHDEWRRGRTIGWRQKS